MSYPYGLICGLLAVGCAPPYGIFPEQEARRIPFEEVVMGAEANSQRILATLRAGKDDVFLLFQSTVDAERGFCTYPMRRRELLQAVKGAPFRLISRCVITQSSGKQRIIDNADQGGQSELSSDANKLVLCTPLRPAQHIRYSRLVESLDRRLVFVLVSMYFDDASKGQEHSAAWHSCWTGQRPNQEIGKQGGPTGMSAVERARVAEEAAQFRAPPAPNIDGKRDIPALGLVQSSQPACLRGLLEEESGETNVVSTAT